ncbi:IucA/IucC family protein [Vibrio tapetis]|uniref:AcsD protein n=1 Tax=Vibrio tapetis subsp. tapetis TaxID=1671868 RepID=A0A2N8ZHP1_9VIBR|nr:IucA/IucC family protein [Vibrio tapetis]SON51420.1 AcsD protein [Vibrio tapetis subsp. tapetis]
MKSAINILPKIVSDLAMTHALLNCLTKEYALPNQDIQYQWPEKRNELDTDSHLSELSLRATPMLITLPKHTQIFVLVDRKSSVGSQRYLSNVYLKNKQKGWTHYPFKELASIILEAYSSHGTVDNQELHEQIDSSRNLVEKILTFHGQNPPPPPFSSYIASEQSLWFGHPSHPAPKARVWPNSIPQEDVTPEFQASTPLYQFEVPENGLCIQTNGLSKVDAINALASQVSATERHAIIAMHPAQAEQIKKDSRMQHLLNNGEVRDLGLSGYSAAPTASIRTWYLEEMPYFIKGSLNIRITNCVRKNSWYELESTLVIDKLFSRIMKHTPSAFRGAMIAAEPAVLSWMPENASEEDKVWFKEQTSVILRENFCSTNPETQFAIAATAFARDHQLKPMIGSLIGHDATKKKRLDWFKKYQQLLLQPVLSLFFDYGIVTEPHLQNTVFAHNDGTPISLLLRDFEGVKLTDELGIHHVNTPLNQKVKDALVYSRHKGWQRISYCLFINNISEAILSLTWDAPELERIMWDMVKNELISLKSSLSKPAPEIDELIATGEVACKCNFKVRLAAQADKQVQYVPLTAPWSKEVVYA